MIPPALRVACAAAGVLLIAATGVLILDDGVQRVQLLPVMFGLLFLVPAAFGGGAERWRDLACIEKDARRYRLAALICFSVAVMMYAVVVMLGSRGDLAQSAASLGAAFWVVAMILLFLFAFCASRRRALARSDSSD
jgi:hypothetical protein